MSAGPVVADTFAGRIHVEWDNSATVTPLGQLPFFIEFLKQGGLFDGWVADCPLHYTSPNAPSERDVFGTMMLSMLSGHKRYAHIAALRGDISQIPSAVSAIKVNGQRAYRLAREGHAVELPARPVRIDRF